MHGWRIKAFSDLPVYHHRPTGGGDRRFRNLFREGRMDYSVGSYPPFEILKLVRRFVFPPYLLGSFVRFGGSFGVLATLKEACFPRIRPVSSKGAEKRAAKDFSAW